MQKITRSVFNSTQEITLSFDFEDQAVLTRSLQIPVGLIPTIIELEDEDGEVHEFEIDEIIIRND